MKPLFLDFHRSRQVVPWLGLLLIAAGTVAILSVMTQLDVVDQQRIQLLQDEEDLELKLRRGQAQQQSEEASSPATRKQIDARLAQLLSPQPLLATVETHWSADVALLKLDLDTTAKDVKLDLEARNLNDLLLFIDRLEADPGVDLVTLARSAAKLGDPHRAITAAVEISWRKASAAAAAASTPASQPASAPAAPQGNAAASAAAAASKTTPAASGVTR
ncbi:hypothetical protein [Chitinilyticum litopenaei]|uniref:hypothetical protein n=1 Tax=Chitinilyticum litopenaei TaxID=1121276 RepID=UPI000410A5EC|nr:hypothetical protein [Chitinilyticum litopenaei]